MFIVLLWHIPDQAGENTKKNPHALTTVNARFFQGLYCLQKFNQL